MNTKYIDLINQTYEFPQEEFSLKGSTLEFHGIDLMELVEQYGAPLKFTYLPKISEKPSFASAIRSFFNLFANINENNRLVQISAIKRFGIEKERRKIIAKTAQK